MTIIIGMQGAIQKMSTPYKITRDLDSKECPWLSEPVRAGEVVYLYSDYTYGIIGGGIAVTRLPNELPFFEVPKNAIEPANESMPLRKALLGAGFEALDDVLDPHGRTGAEIARDALEIEVAGLRAAIDLALQLFDPDYPNNPIKPQERGHNRALEVLRAHWKPKA